MKPRSFLLLVIIVLLFSARGNSGFARTQSSHHTGPSIQVMQPTEFFEAGPRGMMEGNVAVNIGLSGNRRGYSHTFIYVVDTIVAFGTPDTIRTLYTYNGIGGWTEYVAQRWRGDRWVDSSKMVYTFGERGQVVSGVTLRWINAQWTNYTRFTNRYDSAGTWVGAMSEMWLSSLWENRARYSITYDGNGNIMAELFENWSSGAWANSTRYTYTYDGSRHRLTFLYELWSGGVWTNYRLETSAYDGGGNLCTTLVQMWSSNHWENDYRATYSYVNLSFVSEALGQSWTSNQWVNYYRDTYAYDGNWRLLVELSQSWSTGQWVDSYRYRYTYNQEGNVVLWEPERWQGSTWIPYRSSYLFEDGAGHHYYYSGYRIAIHWLAMVPQSVQVGRTGSLISPSLNQNYPNPFNPSTTISFDLPAASNATLKIFDVIGREVTTLLNERLDAGGHSAKWYAQDMAGGVYYYQLKAGDFVQTKKLVLLK